MRLLNLEQAAERLAVSPRSLGDRRFRLRVGLHAIRVGRRIGFAEDDVDRLIMRGREHLPGEARR
jgi:hypothetical protein